MIAMMIWDWNYFNLDLLDSLNSSQREAVISIDGSLLIIAGAGSGKTKTITTRVAYLISQGIPADSILTLTFTNKSAKEMSERALALLKNSNINPVLSTFHKFGLIFLKKYLGFDFVVIDTHDKRNILKNFTNKLKPSHLDKIISSYKNSNISVEESILMANDETLFISSNVYKLYQEYLLLLTYSILDKDEKIAKRLSQKYQYIMVDEYQDTNILQFKIIQKLTSTHSNICVVGDDDQSIYSFRGADISNILNFQNYFKDTKVIKLETNYRSTQEILNISNRLISNNLNRLPKELKSAIGNGEKVEIREFENEIKEAEFIVKDILSKDIPPKDIAILFRVNALSRVLEEELNRANIKYKLIGSTSFYQKSEIKDLISYFRIVLNPFDDYSFERIINRPKRGIGKVAITNLKDLAKKAGLSLYNFIKSEDLKQHFSKKIVLEFNSFYEKIEFLKTIKDSSITLFVDEFQKLIDLKKLYIGDIDYEEREANINEFYSIIKDRIKREPSLEFEDLLNEFSLSSEYSDGETLSLLSIHNSKGLEFETVYVVGLEEDIFPLKGQDISLEEERRVAYVAFTRAKKRVVLTNSLSRFINGKRVYFSRSRFIKEAIGEISGGFRVGEIVEHNIFGIGRVVNINLDRVIVNFGGVKREIMSSFLKSYI